MKILSAVLIACTFCLESLNAQVCDDLVLNGCETSLSQGWVKIDNCRRGAIDIQYCHPRFYIGSGHNLTVRGTRAGTIVFDELLDKRRLASGLKVRKAIGKNRSGHTFTGIFTYDAEDHISSCFIRAGEDRSSSIQIPRL